MQDCTSIRSWILWSSHWVGLQKATLILESYCSQSAYDNDPRLFCSMCYPVHSFPRLWSPTVIIGVYAHILFCNTYEVLHHLFFIWFCVIVFAISFSSFLFCGLSLSHLLVNVVCLFVRNTKLQLQLQRKFVHSHLQRWTAALCKQKRLNFKVKISLKFIPATA